MQSDRDGSHSTSVLILDGNAVFRTGLRVLLGAERNFSVVGEFDDTEQAMPALCDTRPQIVLLGLDRDDPPADDPQARAALGRILDAVPGTSVIILGDTRDQRSMRQLITMGARAYLPKSVSFRHLVSVMCIVTAGNGDIALARPVQAEAQSPAGLSNREREVIALVAQAMSNNQVARTLDISEGTVKRHLRNVFAKLNAVSRIDAVNKAVEAAIIPPPMRNVRALPGSASLPDNASRAG